VTIVATPSPDPITSTWIRRFPGLFTPPTALPAALAAALPPSTDAVQLQAWVMAQFGPRTSLATGVLTLPGGPGGDSTLGASARALALLPAVGAGAPARVPAWTLPMLASSTRVAGIIVALGGPAPRTLWLAPSTAEPRWRDLNEQFRAAADSVAVGGGGSADPRGEADVVSGRLRALPMRGRLVYAQPAYARAADGRTRVAVVGALVDDRPLAAPSLAEALGLGRSHPSADARLTGSPESMRARIRALYASMRDAMRRGDWRAFGLAFDSLGALAGPGGR
jgi:uncharacterized protein